MKKLTFFSIMGVVIYSCVFGLYLTCLWGSDDITISDGYNYVLNVTKDGDVITHTKIVFKRELNNTGLIRSHFPEVEYLILDISDTGEVKVLKRYTEAEWENLIK